MISPDLHPRRKSRESVLKALYAFSNQDENPMLVLKRVLSLISMKSSNDSSYIEKLYSLVLNNNELTDKLIKKNLKNWKFNRVAQLDKILLRMGICEIIFMDDIPPKASITEMVEIAKIYSTEDSSSFINGVLDSVYKEIK